MRRFIFRKISSSASYTSDFLTATGITDATIISALTAMEASLASAGLINYAIPASNKIKVLYPFVGGTASLHKFNFLDPRDTDAAFRLIFYGGWTHSSTGALPNGTNGYANTFFSPSTILTDINSTHISAHLRTNNNTGVYDMGSIGTSSTIRLEIVARYSDGKAYWGANSAETGITTASSLGLSLSNRRATNVANYWRAGTKLQTITSGATGIPIVSVALGAINQPGNAVTGYSNREFTLSTIGTGLTDTEITDLTTASNAFQTALLR